MFGHQCMLHKIASVRRHTEVPCFGTVQARTERGFVGSSACHLRADWCADEGPQVFLCRTLRRAMSEIWPTFFNDVLANKSSVEGD